MASPTLLPPKKDVARGLLLRGTVFVHLDPRRDGVAIPAWLRTQPQVVLQIGLDMPVPIPDLKVDDSGVLATLSFQRTPFTCVVPWDAIFAMVGDDGKGMVWPDALPPEIAAEVEREAHRHQDEDKPAGKPDRRVSARRGNGAPRGPQLASANSESERPAMPRPLPASPAPLPVADAFDDAEAEISRAERRRPAASSSSGGISRGTPKKKRRTELPPYLRVIK